MADNPMLTISPDDSQPIPPSVAPVIPASLPLPPISEPTTSPQPSQVKEYPNLIHKKKSPLIPLLVTLVLIGGLFTALLLTGQKQEIRSKASSSDVSLLLIGEKEASAGADLQVSVVMSAHDRDVTAADLIVTFDPEYLEFSGSKPGKALPTLIAKKNSPGSAQLVVALECDTTCSPYKGSGKEVGSFRFKALKSTPVDNPVRIAFGPLTAVTAIGTKENVKGDLMNRGYSLVIK